MGTVDSDSQQATTPEMPAAQPAPGMTEQLLAKSQVAAKPFTSAVPIVGPLIVWFRTAWNSISTRWYVAPLLQQQNSFNALVVSELHRLATEQQRIRMEQEAQLDELQQVAKEISDRLNVSDRDAATLAYDLGKLTYAVLSLEEKLTAPDAAQPHSAPQPSESSCA